MADPPPYSDSDDKRMDRDRGSITGTPRWVKLLGLIALVVIVLFVVVMLIGGGEHGPGRHAPGGGSEKPLGGHTGASPGFERGTQQP